MATSSTDASYLCKFPISSKHTCSCSTCTCSNDSLVMKLQSTDDGLTYALIVIYDSFVWCMQLIYELLFKSFWEILMHVKQELQESQSANRARTVFDKSISNNYPLTRRNRMYRGSFRRQLSSLDRYHRSMSEPTASRERSTIAIDEQIMLIPVRSAYCQTEMTMQTISVDRSRSQRHIHLQEEVDSVLHCRLEKPLVFMNREWMGKHNRRPLLPTVLLEQTASPHGKSMTNKLTSTFNSNDRAEANIQLPSTAIVTTDPEKKIILPEKPSEECNDTPHRQASEKKSKQKRRRRTSDRRNIPLTLAASLHSSISQHENDDFLTKYVHHFLMNKNR